MLNLVLIGVLCASAFHFFGPLGVVVAGVALVFLKGK